jgi:hypothetical protein
MHMREFKIVARLVAAVCVAASLQACASLSSVRVGMLQTENSSSQRSMLSLYNPLATQHRSLNQGMLLRAPEDRNPRYRYLGY